MAQPAVMSPNGVEPAESIPPVAPGKRKRDAEDDGSDHDQNEDEADGEDEDVQDTKSPVETIDMPDAKPLPPTRNQRELVKSCFAALSSFDIEPPILKRPLPEVTPDEEPDTKRQKSAEPPSARSISDKVASSTYDRLSEMMADVKSAVKATLSEMEAASSKEDDAVDHPTADSSKILDFKTKALDLLHREDAYPQLPSEHQLDDQDDDQEDDFDSSRMVLSLIGHAPQERRLFSSLQASDNVNLSEHILPAGVTMTRLMPSSPQEKAATLGEVFAPPRTLPALQPPKQPKTQAKGNQLDFYHPELTDRSQYRSNSYFTAKLQAGHFLDYSHATPALPAKAKQHERAQSLAGKKPSTSELEMTEMDALFRGAFSSFAPCKDDSSAVVPSNIAGRMWWQRAGHGNFQNMIEVEYYDQLDGENSSSNETDPIDIDESALQEAIDNWDESVVDPTLEDVMGTKRDDCEKEADEILDEVSDMIETLASYQRIRNLNLPNSQNRQSSDPVTGDMLATSGPQPTEEEQATYQMLKAQLTLIIKTLPPYVVSKLNGDQLEDLLISTKIEVGTDQYRGVMEEDDAAVQARLRAQQQQQAAQGSARAQRTPSISYSNQYHTPNQQYGTPTRPPSQSQQFYRQGVNQQYQQQYQHQRQFPQSAHQQRPPQPNQYSRPNGYPNQYATSLAKAQTPYGHQNMQYANQQQQFRQMPQQGTPNTRYQHYQQPNYPHQQQAGSPVQANYGAYTNGSGMHQHQQQQQRMSPQVQHRQAFSPSPNMQQNQRYGTPNQGMGGQGNRYQSTPGVQQHPNALGWNTFIPEAQQQRILEQAKARVAAQERTAQHNNDLKGSNATGVAGLAGIGLGGNVDVGRLAAQRASMGGGQSKPSTPTPGQRPGLNGTSSSGHVPPQKVTPVPVPVFPGQQPQQQKPSGQ